MDWLLSLRFLVQLGNADWAVSLSVAHFQHLYLNCSLRLQVQVECQTCRFKTVLLGCLHNLSVAGSC